MDVEEALESARHGHGRHTDVELLRRVDEADFDGIEVPVCLVDRS